MTEPAETAFPTGDIGRAKPSPPNTETIGQLARKNIGQAFDNTRKVLKTAYVDWGKQIGDPFVESPTALGPLRRRDRVIAAALGAVTFHSAIDLYRISYTLEPSVNSLHLTGVVVGLATTTYWTMLTCLIFSGYDRKADFIDVYKAAFMFQVFVFSVGSLGSFVASKVGALIRWLA